MSKKHTILMLLCCLVGMGAAAAILFFGVPVNRVFAGLMILLCPLSHLLMMKFMVHGHDTKTHTQEEQNNHHAGNPVPRQLEQ